MDIPNNSALALSQAIAQRQIGCEEWMRATLAQIARYNPAHLALVSLVDGATLLAQARAQLAEYFARRRTEFDLPLAPRGTPFQQAVWQALLAVPFGETSTYGAIAAAVGRPKAL
ncbi:MAG: MGMT family protein, partial [Burkholderiaceae bacterium]